VVWSARCSPLGPRSARDLEPRGDPSVSPRGDSRQREGRGGHRAGRRAPKVTFRDGIDRNIPVGVWLAHFHTVCVLLAIGTILFELFYFVSILVPRVARFIFVGAILFHISLYVISGHPFFEHIVLNAILLFFLDPEWFPAQVNKLTARRSQHQPAVQAA
jgi:hypothetical protein